MRPPYSSTQDISPLLTPPGGHLSLPTSGWQAVPIPGPTLDLLRARWVVSPLTRTAVGMGEQLTKRQQKRQGVHQRETQQQQLSHIRYHSICLQVVLLRKMLKTLDSRAIFSKQGSEERTYKQSDEWCTGSITTTLLRWPRCCHCHTEVADTHSTCVTILCF